MTFYLPLMRGEVSQEAIALLLRFFGEQFKSKQHSLDLAAMVLY